MRALLGVLLLIAAGVTASAALAGVEVPEGGSVVYKDLRSHAVVEVRNASGDLVSRHVDAGDTADLTSACGDGRFTFVGGPWPEFEPYLINASTIPVRRSNHPAGRLDRKAALADIVAAHAAWETPFVTDCPAPPGASRYTALYGGTTSESASLADGVSTDGKNVVQFRSLAGTVCDGHGALACVVISLQAGREVDMLFEVDLTRYGYEDYWTTDDTTWWNAVEGRYSLSDVATHEFGHFAGLGHVRSSPGLTMFPLIHDGTQTLGLGDMNGLLRRYDGA